MSSGGGTPNDGECHTRISILKSSRHIGLSLPTKPYRYTTVPLHNRTVTQPYRYTTVPLHNRTVTQPYRYTTVPLHSQATAPLHNRTVTQPYRYTSSSNPSLPLLSSRVKSVQTGFTDGGCCLGTEWIEGRSTDQHALRSKPTIQRVITQETLGTGGRRRR